MGLNWEADAVARDIRGQFRQRSPEQGIFKQYLYLLDGKIEDERMPHHETLLTMGIFDEIRRQGGYKYPKGLEKVELTKN